MVTLLISMSWAIVAWLLLTMTFTGIGLSLRKLYGLHSIETTELFTAPWIGFAVTLFFLQVWHIFLPVNKWALLLTFISGTALFILNINNLYQLFVKEKYCLTFLGIILVAASIFLSYQTTRPPGNYDSALYHIPSIKWAYSYPIVPGLGLLQSRMGFNQSYFLFVAMLNHGPFVDKYHHIASGLLLFWSMAASLYAILEILITRNYSNPWLIFNAMFLVPILNKSVDQMYCSSPMPDIATFLFGIVIASELIVLLSRKNPPSPADTNQKLPAAAYSIFTIALLGAIGITVKLSFLVYGICSVFIAIISFSIYRQTINIRKQWILFPAVICSMIIVLWMFRGIILTGYPAYPLKYFQFPVEWRFSPEMLDEMNDAIRGWARMGPDYLNYLDNYRWIKPCAIRNLKDLNMTIPIILTTISLTVMWLRRKLSVTPAPDWLLFVAPLSAIIFCLISAPNPKFAGASFWIVGIGTFTLALKSFKSSTGIRISIICSLILLVALIRPVDVIHLWLNYTGPLKSFPVKEAFTNSGLKIFVPVDPKKDQCGNAPLPNAPRLDPDLSLRKPNDISRGFIRSKETNYGSPRVFRHHDPSI